MPSKTSQPSARALSLRTPYLLLLLLFSGCGQPKETWYDESRSAEERKMDYVEIQKNYGISENDAKDRYWLNNSIIQTIGREKVEIEGQELREKVSQ